MKFCQDFEKIQKKILNYLDLAGKIIIEYQKTIDL